MKAFALALTLILTTATASMACDKQSSDCKKVSMMSKIFHKRSAAPVEAKAKSKSDDASLQLSGTNFIIN